MQVHVACILGLRNTCKVQSHPCNCAKAYIHDARHACQAYKAHMYGAKPLLTWLYAQLTSCYTAHGTFACLPILVAWQASMTQI